jgi:hypothetical protein
MNLKIPVCSDPKPKTRQSERAYSGSALIKGPAYLSAPFQSVMIKETRGISPDIIAAHTHLVHRQRVLTLWCDFDFSKMRVHCNIDT